MAARVLVTAALPYANGAIHLGHMLEAIQTDVYVRARRLAGEDVIFMWADDTHGTPIQLRAQREGITPEALIAKAYDEHVGVYRDFGIGFDIFHTTHSEESRTHSEAIFKAIEAKGQIEKRSIDQLYCVSCARFLPDRFVRGQCPKCGALDQYGDVCEVCGTTYAPTELVEPKCGICGDAPELRPSDHLFVPLAKHESFLKTWLDGEHQGQSTTLQPSVKNYVRSWIESGLRDWDISRDEPYFGFEIPGHPGKYFYVWFDAPVGYIAATQKWCDDNGKDFEVYWKQGRDACEVVHVIGKDIVYFHCLFWPAMLEAAGYTTPSRVQVHGWLQVNGEKMSKSRGTFVLARTYLDHLPPDYLRYYLAAKLSSSQDDLDLSFQDMVERVNADMVNKTANLASRVIKFIVGKLGGTLGELDGEGQPLVDAALDRLSEVQAHYKNFDSSRALRIAIEIAESCNVYINDRAPWKLAKSDPERARSICSVGVRISQIVALIFQPVLPTWTEKVQAMLNLDGPIDYDSVREPLPAGHAINAYQTLAERLDISRLQALVEASKSGEAAPEGASNAVEATKDADEHAEVEALGEEMTIDQFGVVDLRVGKVLACSKVEKAKKLLQLTVSLGALGERNIFSGIALSFEPDSLVGKNVVVVANLKPRKMRFGVSEGMILASGSDDAKLSLVEVDDNAVPGARVS